MKMDDQTLRSLIDAEMTDAIGYLSDDGGVVKQREQALDYYYGRTFGNEVEGRSSVVSTDVADVIEATLPNLIKIFTASSDVVNFEPEGEEDEEYAQQATDFTNYVFNRQNPGFRILYDAFKDALLQKTGVIKYWWDVTEHCDEFVYENVTDLEFLRMMQEEGFELVTHSESIKEGMLVHDFTARKRYEKGQVRIVVIPPEEWGISKRSRDQVNSDFSYHQSEKMVSEIIAMGYDRETVLSAAGNGEKEYTTGSLTRRQEQGIPGDGNDIDPMRRMVLYTEAYVRVDYDGDDYAELRKVTCIGSRYEILDNERIDENPLVLLTPIPMTHMAIGRSQADITMSTQLIKSTLMRQMLDNLYLTNNPRYKLLDGMFNVDDFMTNRPGGGIRVQDMSAVEQLGVQQVGPAAFSMLEYLDTQREQRTGVTRYNQGMDADTLNQTATGINMISNNSQMRVELIARHFAEQLKPLFAGILKLVTRHVDEKQVIRLRNSWVTMDPTQWKTQYDININVGLGTGNKDQQTATLNNMWSIQQQLIQQFGIEGFVSKENIWNTLGKMVENADLKTPETYFTAPDDSQAFNNPQPPPIDPLIQLEQQKLQLQAQKQQQDFAIKQQEIQIKQQELQIKAQEADAKIHLQQIQVGAGMMEQASAV
jgi:hypothetical protein